MGGIIVLYVAGLLLLVAEIFIPSHGVLTLVGLGFVVAGLVQTFSTYGQGAGLAALAACLVLLPAMAFVAVKYWRSTPIGRRIAPPNRKLTNADIGVPIDELNPLIGQKGRTVSPLRPVGICDFSGKRVSCIAQNGRVEPDVEVIGLEIQSGNLMVKAVDT